MLPIFLFGCQTKIEKKEALVITSDIERFWTAFDSIRSQSDSVKKFQLLEQIYLSKGTPGLFGMIRAKEYSPEDYINMINNFPQFLSSIKSNTYKAEKLSAQLDHGIEKLKAIYPELKPAKIYFTIGAMRSGGTTMDSMVLIGSELAMMDAQTDISEFKGGMKDWAENYISTKPLDNIVLLNVHEYVHTQQKPIPNSILHQCLYEGVAEFVSTKALGTPSTSPAIAYGKNNMEVKKAFENEMFFEQTYKWLWSNFKNQFGVRDLGYYIGYAICELHYENALDKKQAIKEMIEIDYGNRAKVDSFIDRTNFFSKPINVLRKEDKNKRPKVISIKEFENGSQNIDPDLKTITVEFSEPLNGQNTGIDYGELRENAFPKILDRNWSKDFKSWSIKVELKPEKNYQLLITNDFRTEDDVPLYPYLIEFKTGK